MAEISKFLGANSSLLYNWIVPWKYYLSAMVCSKENQVFRIMMRKESTEFINLAMSVLIYQFSESCHVVFSHRKVQETGRCSEKHKNYNKRHSSCTRQLLTSSA